MQFNRRSSLKLGAAALGMAAIPRLAAAQDANSFAVEGGNLVIHPVDHASMVIQTPSQVIWVDPVGGAEKYAALPRPGLILITHEHGDHYDAPTLEAIGTEAPIITNPAVHAMLPEALKARATAMENGGQAMQGDIGIEAVPAYNVTEDRLQYHPEGRDNGYVLTIGGKRVYIAGDTEDTPQMKALTGIEIAFLPMNLPYTMTVEQAAAGVEGFKPAFVYPYHHRGSDLEAFRALVEGGTSGSQVIIADWYPGGGA
ncbi:MBL fold metallo-hydrolase [Paracoccus sp. M683]|uniref:MBL fold metallo-hydrolase n=1 Tax=Paracoccus sp. M683 TaxID=2594268 RepID=UPI00117F30AB|nr:MBL fold metallo-hydrolase [Paracoccus sp. M683]TRW99632.1 MBL fold metallo-hydrolase [Paracoccus sp. M683]